MKSEETRFYEVEAFLRNELSPEEAAGFAAEMATDPALREQVAAQRAQQKVEELLIEDDLRADIARWKNELEPDTPPTGPPTNTPRRFPFWAWLGLGAGLVVAFFFLMKQPPQVDAPAATPPPPIQSQVPVATDDAPIKTPSEQPPVGPSEKQTPTQDPAQAPSTNNYLALANRFEEVPAFAGEGVRSGDPAADAFEKAMESLGKKEYSQATTGFQTIKPEDAHWADAQYNLGCLAYFQKKHKQALPFLKSAADNPDFLYADNARWYLALSLLATGKAPEAKAQLDLLLAQPKGDFYGKAQALKKEMK